MKLVVALWCLRVRPAARVSVRRSSLSAPKLRSRTRKPQQRAWAAECVVSSVRVRVSRCFARVLPPHALLGKAHSGESKSNAAPEELHRLGPLR